VNYWVVARTEALRFERFRAMRWQLAGSRLTPRRGQRSVTIPPSPRNTSAIIRRTNIREMADRIKCRNSVWHFSKHSNLKKWCRSPVYVIQGPSNIWIMGSNLVLYVNILSALLCDLWWCDALCTWCSMEGILPYILTTIQTLQHRGQSTNESSICTFCAWLG
jgi:hypothetical protein